MPEVPARVADQLLELDNQLCFALHSTARQLIRAYRPALEVLDLRDFTVQRSRYLPDRTYFTLR